MSILPWDLIRTAFGGQNGVTLDTKIFQLHYRVSFRIFMISSLLLTAKQVIAGDVISCFEKTGGVKDETLNAYCWIRSTYSVVNLSHSCEAFKDCVYPGVGQLQSGHETRYHRYYQWTSVTLFFQAVLCYAPRFLWKCIESGLQRTLAYDRKLMHYPLSSVNDDGLKKQLKLLTEYLRTHLGSHQFYFFKYCCCEVLGLIVVIVNMLLTDVLLGYQFALYGINVIQWWRETDKKILINSVSPMTKIFPLVAKCDPRRYGPSGNIFAPDPICILPLNSMNDKIYLILWFYLLFELFVSILALLFRLATAIFPTIRVRLLKYQSGQIKAKIVEDVCDRLDVGDWFVIYLMSRNVSRQFFQEFLTEFHQEISGKEISV